ncbi:MAG: hypothetical protein M0Z71_07265 [Nitrospiraceae bacterium]|nr:hypothetical protein [Nitrospiraceae bacterium]
MRTIASIILFGLFVAVSPAAAEDVFDGTKPLLCASIEALDCDPGVACERGIPEIMGAPQFLRIDFAKNEIAGPLRTTKIRSMEKNDAQLVLQGFEIGLGWTLAIDRFTGNMKVTFAGGDSAFIVFGACTSQP